MLQLENALKRMKADFYTPRNRAKFHISTSMVMLSRHRSGAVQYSVNRIDPPYLSFIKKVHPKVRERGGRLDRDDGVESLDLLEENIVALETLKSMAPTELSSILERTSKGPTGSKIENYKKKESTAMLHKMHADGEALDA